MPPICNFTPVPLTLVTSARSGRAPESNIWSASNTPNPCSTGSAMGCDRCDTGEPRDHRTTGPQDHRTTGPQDHRTTGPQDHRTTGPQDHRTTTRRLIGQEKVNQKIKLQAQTMRDYTKIKA